MKKLLLAILLFCSVHTVYGVEDACIDPEKAEYVAEKLKASEVMGIGDSIYQIKNVKIINCDHIIFVKPVISAKPILTVSITKLDSGYGVYNWEEDHDKAVTEYLINERDLPNVYVPREGEPTWGLLGEGAPDKLTLGRSPNGRQKTVLDESIDSIPSHIWLKYTKRDPKPSFDCKKASTSVEKMLCGDHLLAHLDRDLASSYSIWFEPNPPLDIVDDKFLQKMKSSQIQWIKRRNQCVKTFDVRECLVLEYESRKLKIDICSYYGAMMCSGLVYRAELALKKLQVFYATDKFNSAISKLKKSTPEFITTTINQWKKHVAKTGMTTAEGDSGANCPGDNCWLDNEKQVQLATNCVNEIQRETDGNELDKSIDGCIEKYLLPPAPKGSLVANPNWVFGEKTIDGVSVDCLPIKYPGSEFAPMIDYYIRVKKVPLESMGADFVLPKEYRIGEPVLWQSDLDPNFISGNGEGIDDYFLENPGEFWSEEISPFVVERPGDYDLKNWISHTIRADAVCDDSDDYFRSVIAEYSGQDCNKYFRHPFACKKVFMASFWHRNGNEGSGIFGILTEGGVDYVVPIVLDSINRIQMEPKIYKH